MRPITRTRTLAAAVANSIALAQTTAGAGNLIINGALAVSGVATIPASSQVTIASTGNLAAINFTLTGTDYNGKAISEIVVGPNNNTVTSLNTYVTITNIAVSGAVGTNVTVGNAQAGADAVVPLDRYIAPFQITLQSIITGTVNYTVQYTKDDVYAVSFNPTTANWISITGMNGSTGSAEQTLISPATAVRLVTNSGGGTAILQILQGGGI